MPYVDSIVLTGLLRSTGGGPGIRFVQDFLRMWEVRVVRLTSALERRDFDDADVVLLSIRSGSTMVGADALEAISGMIHQQVKRRDQQASMLHLPRFHEVGRGTKAELELALAGLAGQSSEAASR